MKIKENYNKLREIFQSKQKLFLIVFGGLILLLIAILPKTKRISTVYPTTEVSDKHNGGIDALRANLDKLKKEASFNTYESSYQKMEEAKEELARKANTSLSQVKRISPPSLNFFFFRAIDQ